MEVLRSSLHFLERTAVVAQNSSYRYADLLGTALRVASGLANVPARSPAIAFPPAAATQPRVALMTDPGLGYAGGMLGTWLARGISVPLCLSHPDPELAYVLQDSGASVVLAGPNHAHRMRRLAEPLGAAVHELFPAAPAAVGQSLQDLCQSIPSQVAPLLDRLSPGGGAMLIYTSGTTGRPKGALHTLGSIDAQVRSLRAAWEWTPQDRILHALPLHHVHGIVNALLCALASGAAVEMLPKFSPTQVWGRLTQPQAGKITLLMGVPTMLAFLLNAYDAMPEGGEQRRACEAAAAALRLTVSGSAACPTPIMLRWGELAGEVPLERYGMTETGMLLGNPLQGERRPGSVGLPFPGVHVRVDPATEELGVRSEQLFAGYWGLPAPTAAAFDQDGYFLTGDTAQVDETPGGGGYYRLLGRTSVDVIKHGGFKISALDVESALMDHPAVAECAVVGLPDAQYGETLGAVVALREGQGELSLGELKAWAQGRLPPYQVPSVLRVLPALPRNTMGKVNKKTLRADVFPNLFPPAGPADISKGTGKA